MKIGVCGGIDRIRGIAENGFDYIEGNFRWIACCSDDEYEEFKKVDDLCEKNSLKVNFEVEKQNNGKICKKP